MWSFQQLLLAAALSQSVTNTGSQSPYNECLPVLPLQKLCRMNIAFSKLRALVGSVLFARMAKDYHILSGIPINLFYVFVVVLFVAGWL